MTILAFIAGAIGWLLGVGFLAWMLKEIGITNTKDKP